MSQELEFEAKCLLDAADFLKLLKELQLMNVQPATQHNHYFETNDFSFRQAGSALRIREKNGKSTLTLKQPAEHGGLLETHQTLNEEEKRQAIDNGILPIGEVVSQLALLKLSDKTIQYLGTLTTERLEIPYKDGTLFLDKSSYLQTEDYEVEFEGHSLEYAEQTLSQLLVENHILPKETANKVARFFTRKAQLASN